MERDAATVTVDYLKTRKQFGIADRRLPGACSTSAADMVVMNEQARSMAYLATMMSGVDDPAERGKPRCRQRRCRSAGPAASSGRQSVQLHGGVGVTMEYKIGHYFKRLTMIDTLFGDADHHLSRLAEQGSLFGTAA